MGSITNLHSYLKYFIIDCEHNSRDAVRASKAFLREANVEHFLNPRA